MIRAKFNAKTQSCGRESELNPGKKSQLKYHENLTEGLIEKH